MARRWSSDDQRWGDVPIASAREVKLMDAGVRPLLRRPPAGRTLIGPSHYVQGQHLNVITLARRALGFVPGEQLRCVVIHKAAAPGRPSKDVLCGSGGSGETTALVGACDLSSVCHRVREAIAQAKAIGSHSPASGFTPSRDGRCGTARGGTRRETAAAAAARRKRAELSIWRAGLRARLHAEVAAIPTAPPPLDDEEDDDDWGTLNSHGPQPASARVVGPQAILPDITPWERMHMLRADADAPLRPPADNAQAQAQSTPAAGLLCVCAMCSVVFCAFSLSHLAFTSPSVSSTSQWHVPSQSTLHPHRLSWRVVRE